MYPIPPTEKLIETKTCRHCSASFPITDKDLEFYEKVSPTFGGKKYSIPTPTLCPDCRQQRRLSFRNERKLYKRKCDATGRDIVSIYAPCEMKWSLEVPLGCSPDKPFKVYHQDYWWSDAWNSMDYGRDFDFGRGFFEQFGELLEEVPKMSLSNIGNENTEYCHNTKNMNRCYLCFGSTDCNDTYYTTVSLKLQNCLDVSYSIYSAESAYILDCVNVQSAFFVAKCSNSSHIRHCYDCYWCHDCLFSAGLRNKQYMILNSQYSESEYRNKISEIFRDKLLLAKMKEEYKTLLWSLPRIMSHQVQCENCTGNIIIQSSDSWNCYDSIWLKNCKNIDNAWGAEDCMDVYALNSGSKFSYEWVETDGYNLLFSWNCLAQNQNILYCFQCMNNTNNCFGCVWLKWKSYCILNKQYTKEEYEELVPKIIEHMTKTGEWGEFFPSNLSPFGYNETVAQEYYPLNRTDVPRHVSVDWKPIFNWSDYEAPFPKVEKIIPASKLPDDITKIPDDILNWAIMPDVDDVGNDENGNDAVVPYDRPVRNDRVVPFRIIKQELEFYRKHNLPIPRRHPDQRHLDRMALRNPRKLFERKCDKCQKDMITTYAPERPEKVYCEECYNKEIL